MADAEAPPPEEVPAEGGEEGAEDAGPVALTELEVMEKMGQLPLESDMGGMKPFFMNTENYVKYNVVVEKAKTAGVFFSGKQTFPYVYIDKKAQIADIVKVGFYSDFQVHEKDMQKYAGDYMLLIRDTKRVFEENFVWAQSPKAFQYYDALIKEMTEKIQQEHLDAQAGGGGGDDAGAEGGGGDGGPKEEAFVFKEDTTVFVKDEPISPRPWESTTKEATMTEVANLTTENTRPLYKIQFQRTRNFFGESKKYNDAPDSSVPIKPQKDPNFNLLRKELDVGVQAVPVVKENISQTNWFRPKNASTMYSAADFKDRNELQFEQMDSLAEFLSAVSVPVEEALQQNETVDIFEEIFAGLGDEDMGFGSKSSSNIKEIRNFHDVTYTKGKRIETVQWVPESTQLLAVSCYDAVPSVDSHVKASISHVLLWSFMDSLAPHASLLSPYDVSILRFYPSNRHYLIGGLSSGQIIVWKLQAADLGQYKNVHKSDDGDTTENKVPQISHKIISIVDDSHRKPVMAICWLPPKLLIEGKRGKTTDKQPEDGPIRFFATIGGDGQYLLWDFEAVITALEEGENDFQWRPAHRIQLQRNDSGTEMGCCHALYCNRDVGDKDIGNFWASTEEGELIYGDWTARGEEDRKPEYCKKMFSVSKTFRPMLSLERSPIFPNIILGVTDWGFYLWKEGLPNCLFSSPAPSSYFTCGVWSPTRPSVIYLGRMDGGLDIWDFSDQSHKPSLFHSVTSAAITSISFQFDNGASATTQQQDLASSQLAVGDVDGHLHVLSLPKNLIRAGAKEAEQMRSFFDREEAAVGFFSERRAKLAEMREEMEKNADQPVEEEKEKAPDETDKKVDAAESAYRKFEAEWKITLQEELEAMEKKAQKGKK